MTRDEEVEARAPRWVTDALRQWRDSFSIEENGLDCKATFRANEFEGRFSVVVEIEARTQPPRRGVMIHRSQARLEEHDVVRFGSRSFMKDRLTAMLAEVALSAFACNTIFEKIDSRKAT